jgi:hypothetical protein
MKRFGAWVLLAALSGCQTQNPYSMFGPNRVPTPGPQSTVPYYPPMPGAAASGSRPSVSADAPAPIAPTKSLTAAASDKEAIRIVENPSPAARTATSGATRSAGSSAIPAPAAPATPSNEKSSRTIRADGNVVPASFESGSAAGQWKSR